MEYEQLLQSELGELEIIREELQNKEYRGMIVKTAKDGTMTRTRLAKKTDKKAGYFVVFGRKVNLVRIVLLMRMIALIFYVLLLWMMI